MYEANLEFSEGLGGGIIGQIPYMDGGGGMNIFWNYTIKKKFTIPTSSFPLVLLCNWKNLNNIMVLIWKSPHLVPLTILNSHVAVGKHKIVNVCSPCEAAFIQLC